MARPSEARSNIPAQVYAGMFEAKPANKINVGDGLIFSGDYVLSSPITSRARSQSAAGVALDASPVADWYGTMVSADTIRVARNLIIDVSAQFTAQATAGWGVMPVTTGSGFSSPTGFTGIPAYWQQMAPQRASGDPGITSAIGTVLSWEGVAGESGTIKVLLEVGPRNFV